MKALSDLFDLINSLSMSEKRYFKLSASLLKGSKNYIRLFDTIDKQEIYDEKLIKRTFHQEAFIKQLPRVKNYLYKLVLKSLRAYHSDLTIDSELKNLIRNVELLYFKELYGQCMKLLRKAKQIAGEYEKYSQSIEIINWEQRVLLETSRKGLNEILEEEGKCLDKLKNIHDYNSLSTRIFGVLRRKGLLRNQNEIKKLTEIIKNPLLITEGKASSYKAKLYYYGIYSAYFRETRAFIKCYNVCKKCIQFLESHPALIKEDPFSYIGGLNNLLVSQFELKKYDEILYTLNKLKAVPKKFTSKIIRKSEASLLVRFYKFLLAFYYRTGHFERGAKNVPEIEIFLSGSQQKINEQNEIELYFMISNTYFAFENYTTALKWLNKIINNTEIDSRHDIYSFARILNLIIHFELGNNDLLDNLVISTYRFLYKRNTLFEFETIVLDFIRKKLPEVTTQKELILIFMELKQELEEIIKDPLEKKALDYFDFISWLESKIQNRSFAEIVKEKASK